MDEPTDRALALQGLTRAEYDSLTQDAKAVVAQRSRRLLKYSDMTVAAELLNHVVEQDDGMGNFVADMLEGKHPEAEEQVRQVIREYLDAGVESSITDYVKIKYGNQPIISKTQETRERQSAPTPDQPQNTQTQDSGGQQRPAAPPFGGTARERPAAQTTSPGWEPVQEPTQQRPQPAGVQPPQHSMPERPAPKQNLEPMPREEDTVGQSQAESVERPHIPQKETPIQSPASANQTEWDSLDQAPQRGGEPPVRDEVSEALRGQEQPTAPDQGIVLPGMGEQQSSAEKPQVHDEAVREDALLRGEPDVDDILGSSDSSALDASSASEGSVEDMRLRVAKMMSQWEARDAEAIMKTDADIINTVIDVAGGAGSNVTVEGVCRAMKELVDGEGPIEFYMEALSPANRDDLLERALRLS